MTDDFIMFAGEAMMPMPYKVRHGYYEKLSAYMQTKNSNDFLDLFEYTIKSKPEVVEEFKQYLTYLYT